MSLVVHFLLEHSVYKFDVMMVLYIAYACRKKQGTHQLGDEIANVNFLTTCLTTYTVRPVSYQIR